ncbi:hypothetical protein HGG82_10720 [Marinomonas sp. M1K-6]|uniref:Outer membrane protein beta-barrel domain-containing protein n=1 Tax=Marinomonas profundi TaxID=2726122 RepID=A0A847R2Q6_9GAMM|nr:hypothetical protein [Marinomonas profundi]NLQ18092.1 hypothetical protein [Marinomonas profundi]UDV04123.1 hypothetical protein J8N69_05005 [Marinomonas profundi]
MKSFLLAALVLVSAHASAESQIASLVNFESTAARPNTEQENITSILSGSLEHITPSNISIYGGFSFILGETFETGVNIGARFYSAAPAFQFFPGIPIWTFVGGGVSFYDETTYYPEVGFRIATSDVSRIDVFARILNSSSDIYDRHIMVGAGLTF